MTGELSFPDTHTHTHKGSLETINELMCEATSQCCNVQLDSDSWTQAYLLLRFGSLGIRWLVGVALPTYIASLEVSWDLVCIINHPVPQRQTGPP